MAGTAAFRRSVEEHSAAVDALLAALRERTRETVPLDDALDRVTARAVTSPVALPLFRNSQMDGIAVRAADLAGASVDSPVLLPLVGEIAAAPGEPAPLAPGTAVRIMTGAPVPAGADAVVRIEDTDDRGAVLAAPTPGLYVREAGSDLAAGAELVPAGRLLRSRHLAALAAAGLTHVEVTTPVRVAIVSTGSELVAPGTAAGPGELFDANGPALLAAARSAGAQVVFTGRVQDDAESFAALLDAAVEAGAELIVTSGGVSMGEHEVVREVLEPRGALVGSVAMQPGGPQGTGAWVGIPVLCFPGNPVSSQLSFELFAAPVLREIAALPRAVRRREPLAHTLDSVAGKRQFLRGVRGESGVATIAGPGSHLVAALAAAELLIVVPEGVTHLDAGEIVETVEL
ncbi:gephyrin-like molybdotransferase Glp [uncultured Schumannella sp.]|uniref:molybdopterin molybdotransferase MoeA n=1 Tax=uncultured Schumannella sp. TaxID=1195956 RepID=UPI0025DE57D6|nr:gephyrin-like molybdotransferase Glp [uncultured Schumannella sp.]